MNPYTKFVFAAILIYAVLVLIASFYKTVNQKNEAIKKAKEEKEKRVQEENDRRKKEDETLKAQIALIQEAIDKDQEKARIKKLAETEIEYNVSKKRANAQQVPAKPQASNMQPVELKRNQDYLYDDILERADSMKRQNTVPEPYYHSPAPIVHQSHSSPTPVHNHCDEPTRRSNDHSSNHSSNHCSSSNSSGSHASHDHGNNDY